MEVDRVEVVEMELKYCERCGALWVRLCGDEEVYCGSCRPLVAELPLGQRVQMAMSSDADLKAMSEFPFFCEGGHA